MVDLCEMFFLTDFVRMLQKKNNGIYPSLLKNIVLQKFSLHTKMNGRTYFPKNVELSNFRYKFCCFLIES